MLGYNSLMRWLTQNYQWIFSGIGVFIVALFIERWSRRSRKAGQSTSLTAQGGKISKSPSASGTGINQTVMETHHHHYGRPAPEPAPPPTATVAEPKSKVNIRIAGCKKIFVHQGLEGGFYECEQGRAYGEAVIVRITNDARKEAGNAGAVVKATVIYEHAGAEVFRAMGTWLNEVSGFVQFKVDDSHSLILALVINGEFSVPHKRRVSHGFGRVSFPTDPNPLDCERAAVTVRVTNEDNGNFYCEEKFEIRRNPLGISVLPEAG